MAEHNPRLRKQIGRHEIVVNRYEKDVVTRPYIRFDRYPDGWYIVFNAFRTYIYVGKP